MHLQIEETHTHAHSQTQGHTRIAQFTNFELGEEIDDHVVDDEVLPDR